MKYKDIYNTVKNVCFRDVVFANSKWVFTALGMENETSSTFDGSVHVITSSDLKNFTDKVIHKFTETEAIGRIPKLAYGNGIYLIGVNDHENTMYRTENLIDYKKVPFPQDFFQNIKFINNQFIAVTWCKWSRGGQFLNYEGHVLTSKDGNSWINQATFNNAALNDVFYHNGFYYVVGTNGYVARSSNFKNWTQIKTDINEEIRGGTGGHNGIVLVADNKIVLYSNDGLSFRKVFTNNDIQIANISYGNGIYMIMTSSPNSVAYSNNGMDWSWLWRGSGGYNYGMAFSQEQQMFLICGNWWGKDHTGSIETVSISRDLPSSSSDMEVLYLYDTNFNFLETIDSFKSFRWRRKYFEAGEFEITLIPTETLIKSIKKNNLILRNNYTEAGIIETVKFEDNGQDEDLVIAGRFLSSILDRRIVKSIINFSGQSVEGMKVLLNQMTPFPSFEIEKTTFDSENINFQCSYKNVYDYLVKLSKFSTVAFRIVPNIENKVFIFENYKGLDRTEDQDENERYSFSDSEYNIEKSSLLDSNSTIVNYCLVGGQGEGSNRILVEVKKNDASGFDLYENFVDSKNQSNQNLSESDYKNVLIQEGKNAFSDEIKQFEFQVYDNDYKDKYDLGDIVNIAKEKWNHKTSARITEVEEIIEDGKRSITIVVGNPAPEKFDE